MKTFTIAEAGSSHDGDFDKALRLVEAAEEAQADACKFQWVSSPHHLAKRRHAQEYEKHYTVISFPRDWHAGLQARCAHVGIEYMCTTYLPQDICVVDEHVNRFKVASFECADEDFLMKHLEYSKPVYISTGLCAEHPKTAFNIALKSKGAILQCTSAYPAPMNELNLGWISRVSNIFHRVGLSDHSERIDTGAMAVCAGATVIEKHLRLDDTKPTNPDYGHSLPPEAFKRYVALVRLAEQAMGDGNKRVMPSEHPMLAYKVKP